MFSTLLSVAMGTFAFGLLVDASPVQTNSSAAVAQSSTKSGCKIGVCEFDSSESPKCWGNYSLQTNYYDVTPVTGVTREWYD